MFKKIKKLISIINARDIGLLCALKYGVAASIEHRHILSRFKFNTIIDIGANRGQFALIARYLNKSSKILSFEPLSEPASTFNKIFSSDENVILYNFAIAPKKDQLTIHVSARDDSSSLLPITPLQEKIFPGTKEIKTNTVQVAPLDSFIKDIDILKPALLKLDVQGFELEALCGCESLISNFDCIYCECSFVELYSGQKLAADVIEWLAQKGFKINGIYNPSYDKEGVAIQADILFQRNSADQVT